MLCLLFVNCSAGLQLNGGFSAAVLFDVAAVRSVLPGIDGSSGSSSKTVVGARFRAQDRSAEARVQCTAARALEGLLQSALLSVERAAG
jgi:hypothetical protein